MNIQKHTITGVFLFSFVAERSSTRRICVGLLASWWQGARAYRKIADYGEQQSKSADEYCSPDREFHGYMYEDSHEYSEHEESEDHLSSPSKEFATLTKVQDQSRTSDYQRHLNDDRIKYRLDHE